MAGVLDGDDSAVSVGEQIAAGVGVADGDLAAVECSVGAFRHDELLECGVEVKR